MKSILKLIKNPAKIIFILDRFKISKIIPDKAYIRLKYRASFGRRLNLVTPKSYNEKLQWLKLYNKNPEYTKLVDKYEVKNIIAAKIGQEYIIPTLGVWDSPRDIEFDKLPNQFVLKCTHDSGGIIICKDKSYLDIVQTRKILEKALKSNFYYLGREWPYKNVKPRIIAEQYMEDSITNELRDYKFFCFDGKVKSLFIASERQDANEEVKFDFFSPDFKHLDFRQGHPNSNKEISRPENFDKMIILAEQLSENMPHVRVDFYEVNGKVYFGEITFFHHNGFQPFEPEEWDYTFGNWLTLPTVIH